MITRRNKINSLNNLNVKRKQFFNSNITNEWLRKTFVRTIISAILLLIILTIQILNFQKPKNALNLVKLKLEYNGDIKTYLADIKKLNENLKIFSNKALETIKIEDRAGSRFVVPIDGEITTYFNENIGKTVNKSRGLIFATNEGESIYSIESGVVIDVGGNKSIGNFIIIKHKGELLSVYKYVGNNLVELNQRIEKGQVIGTSSEKLLLEVWHKNQPIDPIKYMDTHMEQL